MLSRALKLTPPRGGVPPRFQVTRWQLTLNVTQNVVCDPEEDCPLCSAWKTSSLALQPTASLKGMELLMARARFRAFPWIEPRALKEHDSHNSDPVTVECLFPSQFALNTGVPKEPRPVSSSWVWLELAGVFRIRPQPGQSVFCPGKAGPSYFITERSRGRADLGLSLLVRSCSSLSFETVSLCVLLCP